MLYHTTSPLFKRLFVLLMISLGATACSEDEIMSEVVPEEVGYAGVDKALWPYFERFEAEGRARGQVVDLRLAQITGMIEKIDAERVLGQCSYQRNRPGHLTIDTEFWEINSDLAREFVVFHELGHCFLQRNHREDVLANGRCASIMRSGNGTCRDGYNRLTRDAYLEELFDLRLQGSLLQ